jgi:anti-anti-sigma factor
MTDTRTFHHVPQAPFAVATDMHDGHLAVDLSGELDLACTDALERDGHEDDTSVSDVVVDMSLLEFIDTAGVRALIEVKNRHLDRGRTVQMVNPVKLVRKVVGLYGRADLLTS